VNIEVFSGSLLKTDHAAQGAAFFSDWALTGVGSHSWLSKTTNSFTVTRQQKCSHSFCSLA